MPSAQRVQWAKLRITVLSVAALAILGVLVYLLSGGTWLKPKTSLTTYVPDSTGLEAGADVELNGVNIGKVEWLRLTKSRDPNRIVEVRLRVQEQFLRRIPEDSLAGIDSATLLGDKYLDISIGKSLRSVLPGGELRFRPATNLLKNIDMAQFGERLKAIDQVIRDIQAGKGSLGEFVKGDQMYRDVLTAVGNVEKGLLAASNTHSRIGRLLYSAAGYDNIRTPVRELDDRLARLQASPALRDSAQYDQILGQIAQVRQALADLNAGIGAGGRLLASDATYDEWNRRLAAWIESVNALNSGQGGAGRMMATEQAYESLNGALRSLQATVQDFRKDPRKFLWFKVF
jgi:phospholipid/cholesterol/gamma-HCH transport system substrate-binding protein